MGLKWTKRNGEQILRYIKEIFWALFSVLPVLVLLRAGNTFHYLFWQILTSFDLQVVKKRTMTAQIWQKGESHISGSLVQKEGKELVRPWLNSKQQNTGVGRK
jgi:hypothetical protein